MNAASNPLPSWRHSGQDNGVGDHVALHTQCPSVGVDPGLSSMTSTFSQNQRETVSSPFFRAIFRASFAQLVGFHRNVCVSPNLTPFGEQINQRASILPLTTWST